MKSQWTAGNYFRRTYSYRAAAIALCVGFLVQRAAMAQLCGDFDMDGDVDTADRVNLMQNWTGAGGASKSFEEGDCDGDGDVDAADSVQVIQNWTGAQQVLNGPTPAVNLVDGADADLIYDRLTGDVTLDASDRPAGVLVGFVLATPANNLSGLPALLPFIDTGTNTDATSNTIGQLDALNLGVGATIPLGSVFPPGMSNNQLINYLTVAQYVDELGSGGKFDLVVENIPEPSSICLLVVGLTGALVVATKRSTVASAQSLPK